jgi:hypothetical protein
VSNLIGEALKWRSRDEPFGRCGEKQFKYTISGTFIEQFEIEAFPRDIQTLSVKISSPLPAYLLQMENSRANLTGGPIEPSGGSEAWVRKRLDEIAVFESKSIWNLMGSKSAIEADAARLFQLKKWRQEDSRVQQIFKLAPFYEHPHSHKVQNHNSVVQKEHFGMGNVWHLSNRIRVHAYHSLHTASGNGELWPCINFTLLTGRRPEYFFWNVEIPMFVLTTLTAVTFGLPVEDISDRLGVSLTLVLTAVAYKLTVASAVPQVSYMTRLDKFISMCFLFISIAAVENAVVPAIPGADHSRLDNLFAIGWLSAWGFGLGWYITASVQEHKQAKEAFNRHETWSADRMRAFASHGSADYGKPPVEAPWGESSPPPSPVQAKDAVVAARRIHPE